MKRKIFSIGAALAFAFTVTAQTEEVTNKNGVIVTPEAGDWAIGFNAAPLLNYAGNMLNGTANNSMNSAFVDGNQAIYGKYFVDASTAYRGSLRIANMSTTIENLYGGTNGDSLTNTAKYSGGAFYLSAGMEKRRGKNRLQGYYGGEIIFMLGGTNPTETYTYAVDADTANFNAGLLVDENGMVSTTRTDSKKYGSTFGFGLRGFIGAEYFIMPKISIAAEYGWGLSFSSTKGSETVTTTLDITNNTTESTTVVGGGTKSFGIDTDNLSGAIRLMFHF